MNFTLILGSIRHNRESHKPALFLRALLEKAGHQIDFIDLKEFNLPLFNDTPEQMNSEPVQRFIKSILACDGLFLVFPEYNHSVSPALNNAIDFLRQREPNHKPVGLVGVSNGMVGGARALLMTRGSLPTLGAVILPTVVGVAQVPATFPDENTCTNPRTQAAFEQMIIEMSAYAPAFKEVREKLKSGN